MKYEEVEALMESRVIHSARIRLNIDAKNNVVKDTLNNIFKYISAFNNLEECSDRIFDTNLSNFKIINEFVPFIYPDSVRWDPKDRRTNDLLIRNCEDKFSEDYKCSVNDFHDLEAEFRRWFRKDMGSEFTTLDQLKVPKSLAEIESRMMISRKVNEKDEDGKKLGVYDFMVKIDGTPFIGVPLDGIKVGGLFTDRYFNSNYFDNLKDYFAPLVF